MKIIELFERKQMWLALILFLLFVFIMAKYTNIKIYGARHDDEDQIQDIIIMTPQGRTVRNTQPRMFK